ncbi:hypothetical protein BY996DRAFT_8427895 [Phakopsora pachyrhizi]|nr:hypothetical protein BY996DRAFT_8427895 [Phakopsora pachyrhizi]
MDGNTILIQTPVSVDSAKGTPNTLFPIGSSATIIPLSQKIISLKDWLSRHFFVSSDCFPTPNSVGAVDDETQSDFERDQESNPLNSKRFFDTYLGILLDIIQRLSVDTAVTVLPRLSNQTIPLTFETKRPRDSEENLNYFDITTATTDRSRTTANIDKTGKLLAWKDICDLHTKDESLGLIGSHWDMVDKLPLVMTNPMIKPMSSIISDAIMANSSLDLKPLMLNLPQRLSNQHILYNNIATATTTPLSNIINYFFMRTDGTDSPRGGA